MSTALVITLTVLILFITFGTLYYLGMKIAENRKILLSGWINGTIALVISLAGTVLLSYFAPFEIVATMSALIWGSSMGFICGLANFKYKYKNILKLKGKF